MPFDYPFSTKAPASYDTPVHRLAPATLARFAVAALVDEATLTPKPGLVDLRSRGAHRDLDWALMCRSACVLHPTFHAMAVAGALAHDAQALREELGQLGRDGEAAMLHATCGTNTHRGAIWCR